MNKLLLCLIFISTVFGENQTPRYLIEEKMNQTDLSPYGSIGFSSLFHLPYILNGSVGIRYTKNHSMMGFDGSINYTTNGISNNLFLKGFVPFYTSPLKAKNSYYLGPYLTMGRDFPKYFPCSGSMATIAGALEFEGGFSFGKNNGENRIYDFWQISTRCVSLERKIVYRDDFQLGAYHFTSLFPGYFRFDMGFIF